MTNYAPAQNPLAVPSLGARRGALSRLRDAAHDPLRLFALLWPLALLTPLVPGLPRPAISGLSWRQESALAFVLCLALALLVRREAPAGRGLLGKAGRADLPVLLPLTLFVLWGGLSALWSASPYPAFHYGLTWCEYLVFFLLARRAAACGRLLRASLASYAVAVLCVGAASAAGYWLGLDKQYWYNGLGEPLACAAPFFAAQALGARGRGAAWLWGLTSVVAWNAVMEATERAPFVGACAAFAVLALLCCVSRRFRPSAPGRALLLAAALAAVFVLHNHSAGTVERPSLLGRLQSTTATEANVSARFMFWGVALEMLREHTLAGVGANNYEVAFPEARARFSDSYADSRLVDINEGFLTQRAHNEYLQIGAELGLVGLGLFTVFGAGLLYAAARALRRARGPLVPGAVCGLVAFTLSSGASSISFRWLGSGLAFFFFAAVVSAFASRRGAASAPGRRESPAFIPAPAARVSRAVAASALAVSLAAFCCMTAQGLNVVRHGGAQEAESPAEVESLYRAALFWNPYDAPTHFNYGQWLFLNRRPAEAASHLRFGVERAFNSSPCYALLAAAERASGDAKAAEMTLARALEIYPRSTFLRVLHSEALAEAGRVGEAREEFAAALAGDARAARGWRRLILRGLPAEGEAGADPDAAAPEELKPEAGVLIILAAPPRPRAPGASGGVAESARR